MATDQQEDFLAKYLAYTSGGEVPTFFNRWTALAGVGAFLGRNFYFQHGHFKIMPNMYTMLVGNPGTRKSTGIKIMKKILREAGYDTIAANKTSKEKFMMDLAEGFDASDAEVADNFLEGNLWGDTLENTEPAECFIMADEFNNFMGHGNLEFISLLTELWDFDGPFENRIKTGKNVRINNPTINILGGNTPVGFASAFPTEIMGQGFFSRLLLVYSEPNGKRIAFPREPSTAATAEIISTLQRIGTTVVGMATLRPEAEELLDKIYKEDQRISDIRLETYYSRRFTHLIKLCLICTACRLSTVITAEDVVYANTILTHTEFLMPKALGEFGRARHSDVSHKVLELLESSNKPLAFKDVWKHVSQDLDKITALSEILNNLQQADKVLVTGQGILAKRRPYHRNNSDVLNFNLLTSEENGSLTL